MESLASNEISLFQKASFFLSFRKTPETPVQKSAPFNKWETKVCLILSASEKVLLADAVYWNKRLIGFAKDGVS